LQRETDSVKSNQKYALSFQRERVFQSGSLRDCFRFNDTQRVTVCFTNSSGTFSTSSNEALLGLLCLLPFQPLTFRSIANRIAYGYVEASHNPETYSADVCLLFVFFHESCFLKKRLEIRLHLSNSKKAKSGMIWLPSETRPGDLPDLAESNRPPPLTQEFRDLDVSGLCKSSELLPVNGGRR
jgi:hypothetical protein